MTSFVTGATGLIGTHLVEQLVGAGEEVLALTRDRAHATHLPETVTVVEGDVADRATLRPPIDRADRVYHMAAWFPRASNAADVDRAEAVNIEGTRNVLELMDAHDVDKGVLTSTLGVFAADPRRPIRADRRPPRPEVPLYFRTKWEALYQVAEPMAASGLPLVTVLPGFVFGRRADPVGTVRRLFRAYLSGEVPVVPRGHVAPWDHAADIAAGHRRAMDRGAAGGTYLISGPPRQAVDVFRKVSAITGRPMPRAVPSALFGPFLSVSDRLDRAIGLDGHVDPAALRVLAGDGFPVERSPALEELGLSYPPLADRLRTYLDWEQRHNDRDGAA